MSNVPVVSAVVPVFNERRDYIEAALRSLIDQSFASIEIIVVDDSSNDTTTSAIDRLASCDPRIRVLRPLQNKGLAAALNLGINVAKGRYIARADSDDVQHPDRFRRQVDFLDANPHVGVVGAAMIKIDEQGTHRGVRQYPRHHNDISRLACIKSPVCHPVVMLRRSVIEKFGSYDPTFRKAEDYELWLRFLSSGVIFANLADPLVLYRLATGSKRGREQWRFNLRAKFRHFGFRHLFLRLAGIAIVAAYYALPGSLQNALYEQYNRT